MNEFTRMIREAFAGEAAPDPSADRTALQAALRRFERRDRVVRLLAWSCVSFFTVVAAWTGLAFWRVEPASDVKHHVLFAALFLFAMQGISWMKLFLVIQQADLALQRELKRVRLELLELRGGARPPGA